MKIKWKILTISMLISFLPAILGSLFMIDSIDGWYSTLNKPWFTPPNWLFGPVWTTLYILMGISLYYILISKISHNDKKIILFYFGLQLILNGLWTPIFFTLHAVLFSFIIIICLHAAVANIIILSFITKQLKKSAYLLIPYMIWLIIAMMLNLFILLLNPGL